MGVDGNGGSRPSVPDLGPWDGCDGWTAWNAEKWAFAGFRASGVSGTFAVTTKLRSAALRSARMRIRRMQFAGPGSFLRN